MFPYGIFVMGVDRVRIRRNLIWGFETPLLVDQTVSGVELDWY